MLKNMEKGSKEAKEQGRKMKEGKEKKKQFEDRIEVAILGFGRVLDGLDKRLQKLEGSPITQPLEPSSPEPPQAPKKTKTEIKGLDLLPYKAGEILKQEFPEAKLVEVKPYAKGFRIILDVTHLLPPKFIPITNTEDGTAENRPVKDHRDIPVRSVRLESDMRDRIKAIKVNMGLIRKEKAPEFTEKEVPAFGAKALPSNIAGSPEAEFFSRE